MVTVMDMGVAPVIPDGQTFSCPENSAGGAALGTLVATDENVDDVLSYYIVGGSGANPWRRHHCVLIRVRITSSAEVVTHDTNNHRCVSNSGTRISRIITDITQRISLLLIRVL